MPEWTDLGSNPAWSILVVSIKTSPGRATSARKISHTITYLQMNVGLTVSMVLNGKNVPRNMFKAVAKSNGMIVWSMMMASQIGRHPIHDGKDKACHLNLSNFNSSYWSIYCTDVIVGNSSPRPYKLLLKELFSMDPPLEPMSLTNLRAAWLHYDEIHDFNWLKLVMWLATAIRMLYFWIGQLHYPIICLWYQLNVWSQ